MDDFDKTMRRQAFDCYFSGVMSMSLHPGTTRDAAPQRTVSQCRDIALSMLRERDALVAVGEL